jgi:ATP-dependent Clp protease ATP-binding subunit ClpC
MFETFSEAARRVVFVARFEAGRLQWDSLCTPHLLLGFLVEDQGETGNILSEFGHETTSLQISSEPAFLSPDTAAALKTIFSEPGALAEPQPPHEDMPLSEGGQKALLAAFEYANGKMVTPLHLLRGMFYDESDPVARTLIGNGVTRQTVEAEIQRRRHE